MFAALAGMQVKNIRQRQRLSLVRRAVLCSAVVSAVLLEGCAHQAYRTGQPVVVESSPAEPDSVSQPKQIPEKTPVRKAPEVRYDYVQMSAPARKLVGEAYAALQKGRWQAALSKAERAQRLSSKSPEPYEALAAVRAFKQNYPQAEQLYLKALSLAGKDAKKRASIWRKVAQVRRDNGDVSGADRALANAR
ncbi:protein containing tetratricopeptide repeats [Oleiphilus messinensis]|uniref:Protein containing tetratricopeptide repeats n=1 Tax=Oleiphilus messinensis TaxID=141451 RepID=A0A1Y0IH53_9GAMM|nr:hypothetical protein [Oleiphilus messinensis]ARU58733.1 protein containing tetratricopeptide repeats [Oleiphilus messinensis]